MNNRKPNPFVPVAPMGATVKPGSKIPISTLGNRAIATAPEPSVKLGSSNDQNRADYLTYFTKPPEVGKPTPVLYEANRNWTDVTLVLETAGPVAVGTRSTITPVLSGQGMLLTTDQPLSFRLAKGNKLYVAATAINRIKVQIQPVPWLEQITALVTGAVELLKGRK